jgi:hypothetical protein
VIAGDTQRNDEIENAAFRAATEAAESAAVADDVKARRAFSVQRAGHEAVTIRSLESGEPEHVVYRRMIEDRRRQRIASASSPRRAPHDRTSTAQFASKPPGMRSACAQSRSQAPMKPASTA